MMSMMRSNTTIWLGLQLMKTKFCIANNLIYDNIIYYIIYIYDMCVKIVCVYIYISYVNDICPSLLDKSLATRRPFFEDLIVERSNLRRCSQEGKLDVSQMERT
jgi:hypothetical protein